MNCKLKFGVTALAFLCASGVYANRELTFYEGFEGRLSGVNNPQDFASNVWLPDGWTEFSKIEGHKNYPDIPGGTSETGPEEWDYTWCTKPSGGLYGVTPFGGAYAHVMTHNWSVGQDRTPKESDEWLVTPAITIQDGDVLSFATSFNPYLTIRPDGNFKPTAKTNVLEVRISTDGGTTWSDPLWDSYTETLKMSIDEVMSSIVSYDWTNQFKVYFVDLESYYGQEVKIAFRYFGKNGADISLDEISVGVPTPEASYELPEGYLWPALTEKIDLAKQPLAYAPAGQEHTWVNTSLYAKSFNWTFGDAQTDDSRNLVTPAFTDGSVAPFPTLNSSYGINESGVWSLVNNPSDYLKQLNPATPMIQYGGTIGKTVNADGSECRGGVCTYNLWDPDMIGVLHQPGVAISSQAETLLDNRYTNGSVRSWDFLQGIGTIYPKPGTPYGVDYVYANVLIENIEPETDIRATIYPWVTETIAGTETSYAGDPIAVAPITYDPASVGSGTLTTIMFDFSNCPVTVDSPYIVLISGFKRSSEVGTSGRHEILDNIRFPYVLTASDKFMGTSVATVKEYDSNIDGYFPAYAYFKTFRGATAGSHVAGLLMGVGISHSTMSLVGDDNVIDVDPEGGAKTFTINASTDPSTWRLLESTYVCPWAQFTANKVADGVYDVTITVDSNYTGADRNGSLRLASSGSFVTFVVSQQSGIENISADEVNTPAEYFDLRGVRTDSPRHGIFIKRRGNKVTKVIR